MDQTLMTGAEAKIRERALNGLKLGDNIFGVLCLVCASFVLVLLGGIILSLIIGAWPAIEAFGFGFLTSTSWNTGADKFGALPAVYGTMVTAIIALVFAVPVGLGIAIFLTELCPMPLRRPIGVAIELLAGIPSIIYGIWGFFIFAPFFQSSVQPGLVAVFGKIPLLSEVFVPSPFGSSVLTAGLILAIMVLPFITSISRDVFDTVPAILKESAFGIGCTTWEVVTKVVIPYTRSGVIGGVMLGLGRALGETMAVTFVIGNSHKLSASILQPGTTISATIASEFNEAEPGLHVAALTELGLILFVITFFVLAGARLMLMRLEKAKGV